MNPLSIYKICQKLVYTGIYCTKSASAFAFLQNFTFWFLIVQYIMLKLSLIQSRKWLSDIRLFDCPSEAY